MHSVNHATAFANNKRSPRGSNLRSSVGNGLVLETLEEELKFGDADSYKACVQLDLLRACVALRCNCVPYVGAEMKKVFALPEDGHEKHEKHDKQAHATTAANNNAIKGSQDKSAPTGILNRTKSSLMTKLFTATEKEDAPPPVANVVESPGRPLSVARAQSGGGDAKKKLTLIDILKLSVKLNQVEIFQQNLRDVINIEDQAAATYVSIKTKEIRTTIFAGYALLVHSEFLSQSPGADVQRQMQLALALMHTHQPVDTARALGLLQRVANATSGDSTAVRPLARLLAGRLLEQRKLEDANDRQAQQLRDQQRRIDQLTDRLEAMRAIERSLNTRPPAAPRPPAQGTTP